jgi:hypothetical protein
MKKLIKSISISLLFILVLTSTAAYAKEEPTTDATISSPIVSRCPYYEDGIHRSGPSGSLLKLWDLTTYPNFQPLFHGTHVDLFNTYTCPCGEELYMDACVSPTAGHYIYGSHIVYKYLNGIYYSCVDPAYVYYTSTNNGIPGWYLQSYLYLKEKENDAK